MKTNLDLEIDQPEITNNRSKETKSEPTSWTSKIRAVISFLTIEPFLFTFVLPYSISSIAVQQLNLEKACRVDLNQTKEKCDEWDANITVQIQSMVADMTTWSVPLQTALPAIVILFVGAWSDRTGNRKILMLTPILGELISAIGLILTTYYFEEWPLWVTALIESIPTALSGGLPIALMGAFSYLADHTSVESRTFRLGIAGVIVTLGLPAGISISGILLESYGYYGIFGTTTALYSFGFLYTFFRVHDLKHVEVKGTWFEKLIDFFHPRNAWQTLSIIVNSNARVLIILVITTHFVFMGPGFGEGAVLYQYLVFKYQMNEVEISLFYTYSILVSICGTAVAVTVFSKWLKMHDSIIGIIATTCKVVSCCVYALAPTKPWFYSGPAFDFFGNTGATAVRALGTKVVEPEQVGKICSILGLVEAVVPVIYTPIYSQMYKITLETLPGAFYLLGSAMTAPAFLLYTAIYILHRRKLRDEVKNPNTKEMYAHENAVTSF